MSFSSKWKIAESVVDIAYKGTESMIRKKLYFDDVFADILLMHTLNHATFKGAEIGECLAAAAKVVEGDAESWRKAWQEQGERAEAAGRQADDSGHGVSAREAYLRAVTYYYHACLAIGVDNPAFRAGVEHYRSVFQRFAALSTPAIEVIGRACSAGTTCCWPTCRAWG